MPRSKEDWVELKAMQAEQQARYKADRTAKAAAALNAKVLAQQQEICQRVSCGQSMLSILTEGDRSLPSYRTALGWLTDYPDFTEAYNRAQKARADVLFEETLSIADDARNDWMASHDPNNPGFKANLEHIQRSKLRVDTRKWAAAKLHASKYNDRVEVSGDPEKPVVVAVTHRIVQVIRQETLAPELVVEHDPVSDADQRASGHRDSTGEASGTPSQAAPSMNRIAPAREDGSA